jgi:hypothetical protein
MIRGPNIAPNVSSDFPVTTVDILPTILDLAGITEHNGDGHSFKEELFKTGRSSYNRNLLVEYWGEGDASTNDPACPWGTDDTISVQFHHLSLSIFHFFLALGMCLWLLVQMSRLEEQHVQLSFGDLQRRQIQILRIRRGLHRSIQLDS